MTMTSVLKMVRRTAPAASLLAAAGLLTLASPAGEARADDQPVWVYVGTYTSGKSPSEGVYKLEFDANTGKLTPRGAAAKLQDPSFLAVHPNGRFLYAVNELGEFQGAKGGGVSALSLDPATGDLKLLNQRPTDGGAPCFLTVDARGRNVLVANYSGGSVACLPIADDGSLGPRSSFIQHEGHSVDPARQKEPHAHSINLDPTGRFALAADLGLDQILVYEFDAEHGKLAPNDPPFAKVEPGSGPRHLAWHPSGAFAYVITEMGNTIDVFAYDAEKGTLRELQSLSTLPADFQETSYCAEVVAHPSGKFVYGSNRGHDSIAVFTVDRDSGKLTPAGHQLTLGKNPRGFALDPSGKFLLAANMETDTIAVFRVDPETGALTPVGQPVAIPRPVCVRFASKTPTEKQR